MTSSGFTRPQRIAVLGGGMSALTAAYHLARLNTPGRVDKYDITVYQQGWRLGGKGASGRNAKRSQRIEEHGLHIWFGAYENAFRLMREVYQSTKGHWPNGQLADAFKPQYGFDLAEELRDRWDTWHFPLPPFASEPGDANAQGRCTPRSVLPRLVERVGDYYGTSLYSVFELAGVHELVAQADDGAPPALPPDDFFELSRDLETAALSDNPKAPDELVHRLERFHRNVVQHTNILLQSTKAQDAFEFDIDDLRRAATIVIVALTVIRGTLNGPAWRRDDWDELNGHDLKEWLKDQIGLLPLFGDVVNSVLVEASYDLYFSYPGGDTERGKIEAGSMLRAAVWLLLEYKGAFMWRMRSGMGDTIFAPLYHALTAMKVEFRFFHRVTKLSTDGQRITAIDIEEQAKLKQGARDYPPFVAVKGQDCWPSEPKYDILEHGSVLAGDWDRFNLESDWSEWPSEAPTRLSADLDFDQVILGIPIAALRPLCTDLTNPTFQAMLTGVPTVQTQALQLWLKQPLGWLQGGAGPFRNPPVLTTFKNPIDTYADMSDLVDREDWGPGEVRHIAYFCGVLKDFSSSSQAPTPSPPPPVTAKLQVRAHSLAMLAPIATVGTRTGNMPMRFLWPGAFASGKMDWNLLCGSQASNEARLDDQYLRANIDATERYVVAAPGTSRLRVKTDGSGYSNLFLAGDWTYNGLFLGCIEGAVISGMQAARALSGQALPIVGEGNLFKAP